MSIPLLDPALTPAAWMTPNREANTVANVTVKPSVVVVPTCNSSKDNQSAQGIALGVVAAAIALVTSSETAARDLARETKPPTTRTATSARSVQFFSFQPTKPTKESNMMNKIMISLFAVILAAFAMSAVMRERVKAEAALHAVEVVR